MSNKMLKKQRGRPRAFDKSDVLRHAQGIFLTQGFEATSYDDVAAQTGLSKPSLYNAFGDKTAFFGEAVAAYAQSAHHLIIASFAGAANLKAAAQSLLLAAADVYAPPGRKPTGCLLVGTALPASTQHIEISKTLDHFIEGLEAELEPIIVANHANDMKRLRKSARTLALHTTSLLFALAVRARTPISNRKLRSLALELAETMG